MSFAAKLRKSGLTSLQRDQVRTLQINVGKVCNQACHHCHVEAGPKRTESLAASTAERLLTLLQRSRTIECVDITGGAPELNPSFRTLVRESRSAGKRVIDRCNLTILLEPGFTDLPAFLKEHQVHVVASLPCYTAANVDQQRGRGVFDRSIRALQMLNGLGYGKVESGLTLDLVFNPGGASLPPPQQALEVEYKRRLREDFAIEFNSLFTITNMPIRRFSDYLVRIGKQDQYQQTLVDHFNPDTVSELMCRSLVSVSWDGQLYDCDFNQMVDLPTPRARSIWEITSFDELGGCAIATGEHCYGCTAGTGSSCGGQLQ